MHKTLPLYVFYFIIILNTKRLILILVFNSKAQPQNVPAFKLIVLISLSISFIYFNSHLGDCWKEEGALVKTAERSLTMMSEMNFTRQKSTPNLLALLMLMFMVLHTCSFAIKEQNQEKTRAVSPVATNGQPFPWNQIRLPETVIPFHYDLLIHPNLTSLDFTRFVQIDLEITQDTQTIILHSEGLQISKAALRESGRTHPLRVLEFPSFQQLALLSDDVTMAKGHRYSAYVEFSANLSETFHGFYKSTYRTPPGEIRVLASTQFEPTSARAAFPCFDEPALKANFSIRIRREPGILHCLTCPSGKWWSWVVDLWRTTLTQV